MALVKCPECGREKVSDSAEACPECGYGIKVHYEKLRYEEEQRLIQEKKEQEKEEEEKKKLIDIAKRKEEDEVRRIENDKKRKVKNRKLKKVAFIIVTICCILTITKRIVLPAYNYSQAIELLETGNYLEAKGIFEKLGNYKESVTNLQICQFEVVKQDISKAENLAEALLYLNGIELDEDVENLKATCLWKLAQNSYDEENYAQAINYLEEIGNLNILAENQEQALLILDDSLFKYGLFLYEEGDFSSALQYLERINEKDDSAESYVEKSDFMLKMQGKWECEELGTAIEINDWTMKKIYYNYYGVQDSIYDLKDFVMRDGELIDCENESNLAGWRYGLINGKIVYYCMGAEVFEIEGEIVDINSEKYYFEKTDSIPESPEAPKAPAIGMTAAEVLASTWGEPEDINKTTYSWGVKEQWCYSGYRYIYLEDGIVTSISE